MNIIDRKDQYIQSGRSWYTRSQADIAKVSVHHSVTYTNQKSDDQMLRELHQIHVANGWPGLSYHIVILPNGHAYQINDFTKVTWIDSTNWDSIGVCVIGYYHPPANHQPTLEAQKTLKEVLDWICTQNPQLPADHDDVLGHRERYATACPGDNLFPYVIDYRTKLGKVSWGTSTQAPAPGGQCLLYRTDEDQKKYEHLVGGAVTRKEVAEYLKLPNPDAAPTSSFTNSIGGIKSSASALQGQLLESEKALAKANQEVKNREEQAGRLKTQTTDTENYYKSLLDKALQNAKDFPKLLEVAQSRVEDLQTQVNETSRAKGIAQNEAAEAKAALEICQKGGATKSLWQTILEFLNRTKVVG